MSSVPKDDELMSFEQLKGHLSNFGIKPGDAISLDCMHLLVKSITKWYGEFWAITVFDLFLPIHDENNQSTYVLTVDDWDELEDEWPRVDMLPFYRF